MTSMRRGEKLFSLQNILAHLLLVPACRMSVVATTLHLPAASRGKYMIEARSTTMVHPSPGCRVGARQTLGHLPKREDAMHGNGHATGV